MGLEKVKTLTIVAAVILVLFLAWTVWQSIAYSSRQSAWLQSQTTIFNELQSVRQSYRNAERSQRDFVVNGTPEKLTEFSKSFADLEGHLAAAQKACLTEHDLQAANLKDTLDLLGSKAEEAKKRLNAPMQARKANLSEQSVDALYLDFNWRSGSDFDAAVARVENTELQNLQQKMTEECWASARELMKRVAAVTLLLGADFALFLMISSHLQSDRALLKAGEADRKAVEADRDKKSGEILDLRDQLDRLADFDYVTELPNVRSLERVFMTEEGRNSRAGNQMVAILINCDNFSQAMEQYGQSTGDHILKEVGRRIAGNLRPSDHVARVGADEFLVLLLETQLAHGLKVAERIRTSISDNPVLASSDSLRLTVSLGVASVPPRTNSIDEVFAITRSALKRSKNAGKNLVSIARESISKTELNGNADDIIEVLSDIRSYQTVFQPIVELASDKIAGYEIFSRGPDGKFESPDALFKACIEHGILTNVDLVCLKQCIMATSTAAPNLLFHVNLFPDTLLETPVDTLISLFPVNRKGHKFCIELGEEKFHSDPSDYRGPVSALKAAGIRVAIDDVGYDISSLERLIVLEPDFIKVDRKYVANIMQEPDKMRLLKRLANVAKSLGAELIAEGIESRDVMPFLEEMGVPYGQGFLWGKLLQALPTEPAKRPQRA
jgi:diguanylate cyclase (GGDEF)-like protein